MATLFVSDPVRPPVFQGLQQGGGGAERGLGGFQVGWPRWDGQLFPAGSPEDADGEDRH